MGQTMPNPPPGFDDLSVDEKLAYVQSLWDRIAAKPEEVPVPDWHRQVLDERSAEYEANTDDGRTWPEVREELRRKLRGEPEPER